MADINQEAFKRNCGLLLQWRLLLNTSMAIVLSCRGYLLYSQQLASAWTFQTFTINLPIPEVTQTTLRRAHPRAHELLNSGTERSQDGLTPREGQAF